MNERTSFHPLAQEGGQTLVEFALTVMILLMLVFGLIDFSRAVYAASVVQWAAQQGARTGIAKVREVTPAELQSLVDASIVERLAGLGIVLSPDDVDVAESGPDIVQVDVTYHFEFIVPIIADLASDGIDLQASATMVAH